MEKIDRKKFLVYGVAGIAGVIAILKSPLKLFGNKVQSKILDSGKIKFQEATESIKRKA
jgi:hypothetical protein